MPVQQQIVHYGSPGDAEALEKLLAEGYEIVGHAPFAETGVTRPRSGIHFVLYRPPHTSDKMNYATTRVDELISEVRAGGLDNSFIVRELQAIRKILNGE